MDKPEILSEKKLVEIIQPIFEATLNNGVMPTNWNMAVRKISEAFSVTNKKAVEAQRDADAAYYEQKIAEIFEEVRKLKERIKLLEGRIASHHCQPLPPNIKRCVGTVLPQDGSPPIPKVYED